MTDSQLLQEVVSQFVVSGLITYGLQAMKNASWFPWLSAETKRLNRLVAWLVAAVAAVGIHFQFDAVAGQLVITGLSVAGIRHGAWEYAKQVFFQQFVYDVAIQKKE